jgi:hypothetical protein
MSSSNRQWCPLRCMLAFLVLSAAFGVTGCQVDIGGQMHPSATYMTDDVQYFAPGPEFKLANEAAAMKAAKEEDALRRR